MITKSDQNNLPLVSILVVNYNGMRFLRACLDAIQQHVTVPFEVVMVDNASQDGSVDFIRTNYPWVSLISSGKNLGFAGGNNLAARHSRGEYLLLLNNDTQVLSDIAPLVNLMKKNNSLGVVGGQLFYADGRSQESIGYVANPVNMVLSWLPFARRFPNWSWMRRLVHTDSPLYKQQEISVGWVSGAFLLTRSLIWKQLDGMDANYFMYLEDADYCLRVKEAGWQVFYSNLSRVLHYEGSGRPWIGEKAVVDSLRSYFVYLRKNNAESSFVVFRFCLSFVFLARAFTHFCAGVFRLDSYGFERAGCFFRCCRVLFSDL